MSNALFKTFQVINFTSCTHENFAPFGASYDASMLNLMKKVCRLVKSFCKDKHEEVSSISKVLFFPQSEFYLIQRNTLVLNCFMSNVYWFTLKLLSNFFKFAKFICVYSGSLMVKLVLGRKKNYFYLQVFKRWPALMRFCQRNLFLLNMRRFCSWCSSKLSTYSRLLLRDNQGKTLSLSNWMKGNVFNVKFSKVFPHLGGYVRTHESWLVCFWTIFLGL